MKAGDKAELVYFEPNGYHDMYKSNIVEITAISETKIGTIYHYKAESKLFNGFIHSGARKNELKLIE